MSIWKDLRHGIRVQTRQPGLAVLMVITLALGIGATSAVSSIAYAVFLQPLPFSSADRLVVVGEELKDQQGQGRVSSYPNFEDWKVRSHSFESMAISRLWHPTLRLAEGPTRLSGARVSEELFTVLKLKAQFGRLLLPGDFKASAAPVAVLSHSMWQRLGGDPRLVGRTVSLDGSPFTVVGVLPPGLSLVEPVVLEEAAVLSPLRVAGDPMATRGSRFMRVIARLRPAVTRTQAAREMRALAATLAVEHPDTNRDSTVTVESLREVMVGGTRPALAALLGAALLVLLATSVNVSSMLLIQAIARGKELAIRSTLGAGRRRLARQVLFDSLPLVVVGALLGLVLTRWAWDLFVALLPAPLASSQQVVFDGRVLMASLVTALAAALLVGLAPAVRLARAPLADLLREQGAGSIAVRRTGTAVLVVEMALALVLLVGGGLLVKSLIHLTKVDLGFRPEGVLVVELDLPFEKYGDPQAARTFLGSLIEHVQAQPGVLSAALACNVPLKPGSMSTGMGLEAGEPFNWRVELRGVSPGYFRTMGVPLVQGRDLTPDDADRLVLLLNATAARQLWPGKTAVGQRVILDWNEPIAREVVGLVGDVRHASVDAPARAEVYLPYPQMPFWSLNLVVRSSLDPLSVAQDVRRQIRLADPDLPIVNVTTLDQLVAGQLATPRTYMRILVFFAAAALVLAAIGIYGVTAYGLALRTHEIGVRVALGAQRGDVLRPLLARSTRVIAVGILCGLAGAFVLSRFLRGLLYEVGTLDAPTFLLSSIFLALVALFATWLPTAKAVEVDPARVLKQD